MVEEGPAEPICEHNGRDRNPRMRLTPNMNMRQRQWPDGREEEKNHRSSGCGSGWARARMTFECLPCQMILLPDELGWRDTALIWFRFELLDSPPFSRWPSQRRACARTDSVCRQAGQLPANHHGHNSCLCHSPCP